MWQCLLFRSTIFALGIVAFSNAVIAQPIIQTQPSPITQPQPTTPEQQPSPDLQQQPSPAPAQPLSPVPKAPIPGQSCEAKTVIKGDRILYRTSYINDENLRVDGKPVEVDMLKNDSFAAHASTHYTGDFTFTGTTETGTPLSFQLTPEITQIKITHGGRTISGKCGDILS
jgi:hypothetical protein